MKPIVVCAYAPSPVDICVLISLSVVLVIGYERVSSRVNEQFKHVCRTLVHLLYTVHYIHSLEKQRGQCYAISDTTLSHRHAIQEQGVLEAEN